jgi:hypothetical protein
MPIDQTLAVEERLIQASKLLVQTLLPDPIRFPNLTVAQVWDQIDENVAPVGMPAIVFTLEGCKERYEVIDENTDHVWRQLICAVVDRNDPYFTANRPNELLWRQNLIRVFRLNTGQGNLAILPNVPEVVGVWMEPQVVLDRTSKLYQYFRSGFLLKFLCREVRGVTAQTGV